jgi:hypothetical protein
MTLLTPAATVVTARPAGVEFRIAFIYLFFFEKNGGIRSDGVSKKIIDDAEKPVVLARQAIVHQNGSGC